MRKKLSAFEDVYGAFCAYLELKNYKTGNGRMYPQAVHEFLVFVEQRGVVELGELNTKLLQDYAEYISNRPNKRGGILSGKTINHYLYGIRLFLDYLLDGGYLKTAPIYPAFTINHRIERPTLTIDDIKLLYRACRTLRDTAILSLGYGCGLRRNEMSELNVQDVILREGYLIVREGKHAKRREVPMTEKISSDLSDYIRLERSGYFRRNTMPSSLLVNNFGWRMTGDTIYKHFRAIASNVKTKLTVDNPCLHDLRHAVATHLMENGAGIEFIKSFLGHSLIDTAQLYAIKQKRRL